MNHCFEGSKIELKRFFQSSKDLKLKDAFSTASKVPQRCWSRKGVFEAICSQKVSTGSREENFSVQKRGMFFCNYCDLFRVYVIGFYSYES